MTKLADNVIEMMSEFKATATCIDTENNDVYFLSYNIGGEQWATLLSEGCDNNVMVMNFHGENVAKLKRLLASV